MLENPSGMFKLSGILGQSAAASQRLGLSARGKSPAGLVVSAVGPGARGADRGDAGTSSRRRYTADGPTPPQLEGRQRFAASGRRYSSSPMSKHRLLLEPCQQPQIPGARLHATFTTGCYRPPAPEAKLLRSQALDPIPWRGLQEVPSNLMDGLIPGGRSSPEME